MPNPHRARDIYEDGLQRILHLQDWFMAAAGKTTTRRAMELFESMADRLHSLAHDYDVSVNYTEADHKADEADAMHTSGEL